MKINGSLARQCLADLEEKGMIKPVITHSKMKIYSMTALGNLLPEQLLTQLLQPVPSVVLTKCNERKESSLTISRLGGLDDRQATWSEGVARRKKISLG